MKVSLNWIKEINARYQSAADPAPKGINDLVERIGSQLGAVEEVIDLGKKYEGIVIAKVVKCDRHPNADKLSLCWVDDGGAVNNVKRNSTGLVQVVCGAPNVAAGQMVAWIPPRAVVPTTFDKDPLTIEPRKIHGELSNGMLASAKELALGDNHEGILVIDGPQKPGTALAEAYGLDDHVIDIENKMFTHRPDLFGMLGIAREVAGIQHQVFKSPAWYRENVSLPRGRGNGLKLSVKNELPKNVPRFTTIVIRDIAVGPSPVWLQAKLSRVGIRSINNIVDLTNFIMYETAQPLHAYDYDKVGDELIVRAPSSNEKLKLLGGKEIKLQAGDIVIAAKDRAIGLGGVMGGADTEVDETTKNIILECANFDMTAVRRSAMNHGLFTDAATRFTKGQSPRQNAAVVAKFVEEVLKPGFSGGRIASPLIDIKNYRAGDKTVNVTATFINERLGLELSISEIKKLLQNVEFRVDTKGDNLKVEAPFWRTDIEIAEDIVEEVGRLYGFDHLPLELPRRDLAAAKQDPLLELKKQIRSILAAGGANELLTYSFVHRSLLEKVGQDPARSFHIRNALSPDLQYYRQNLIPSLLDKIHANVKQGFEEFCLFEMGKAHVKGHMEDGLPKESERLSLVYANTNKGQDAVYHQSRKYLDYLMMALGIKVSYRKFSDSEKLMSFFDPQRSASIYIGEENIGSIGEFKASVREKLKLPEQTAGFEISISKLLDKLESANYQPLNRFPSLTQDFCLRSSVKLSYQDLTDFISGFLGTEAAKHGYNWQIEPLDIYQKPDDKAHKQTTWRITLEHTDRTLTNEEVNRLFDKLAKEAKAKLKAERI